MPNDLVRYSGLIDDDPNVHHARPTPDREGYENAVVDIEKAEGDRAFAATRAADAADSVQDRWGRGDPRTWGIIWAMFFGFLIFVWFVHSLPTGTHVNPPPIRVY